MKKTVVIMNERHNLIDEQVYIFDKEFGRDDWEVLELVDKQWSQDYFDSVLNDLYDVDNIVFVSPASYMIAKAAFMSCTDYPSVWVLHSDNKVERVINGSVRYIADKHSYKLIQIR